jgi:hypothetical protein
MLLERSGHSMVIWTMLRRARMRMLHPAKFVPLMHAAWRMLAMLAKSCRWIAVPIDGFVFVVLPGLRYARRLVESVRGWP